MPNSYRLALLVILVITLPSRLHGQAEKLKFAWPDNASAKVHVRSAGKQVSNKTETWDMSLDFILHLKRANDRITVSRSDYSGWKGTFPPPPGGGAEQFVDMIPTVILTSDGAFVGIEGHETARKLIGELVKQSGRLHSMERELIETVSSDASLEAMAKQHWSGITTMWRYVDIEPNAIFEFQSVAQIPQLGGGELEITGTLRFLKETSCAAPRNDQRCVHLHSKTGGDKAQVRKIIQSLMEKNKSQAATVTDWDQHINVEIVTEKKTMLPHYLKISRFHSLTVEDKGSGQSQTSGGEYATTYTFTWLSSPGTGGSPTVASPAAEPPQSSPLDFSNVTSKEALMKLASEGKLVKLLMFPAELGGADVPQNVVYVPPGILEIHDQITEKLRALVKEGLQVKLAVRPIYKGNSFVPAKIQMKTSHAEERANFERTIDIW